MAKLTNNLHEQFAQHYVKCFGNGAEAARRAGIPADGNERFRAYKLLEREDVRERVEELSEAHFKSIQLEAADVLRELIRIAMCDIGEAFKEDGTLKNIHDMPIDVRRAIGGIENEELFEWEGSGQDREKVWTGTLRKVKFWNKERGLEMLARTLALFKDQLSLEVPSDEATDENARAARIASLFAIARARRERGEDLA